MLRNKPLERYVTKEDLQLSPREIHNFLSNAQLALVENIADADIPALYFYKTELVKRFKKSKFSPVQLACVLVSAAWDIFTAGEKDGAARRA